VVFVFSSRRRHTRSNRDWSSDVCSSDLMVADNEDPKGTAYTVSCDAVGVTTGISAAERGLTGRVLAAAEPDPAVISRPGHVFPLIAKAGGVRQRPGHTEAGVEFARLAGAQPVA